MTLDAEIVRGRCAEIAESVERLQRFRALPRAAFLEDRDAQDIASYRLLVAIEAALALCYHISARACRRVPEGYAECFEILREAGLLPVDLADRLRQMARFRNILIHRYWQVDYGRVYEILAQNLEDLRAFARVAAGLL